MKEFKIKSLDYNFRVKKMNAIQLLALRSQIDFDDYQKTERMYELILNCLEVGLNDQWLPVREEAPNGKAHYYPTEIETNVKAIDELTQYFIKEILMPVFMNSNASK